MKDISGDYAINIVLQSEPINPTRAYGPRSIVPLERQSSANVIFRKGSNSSVRVSCGWQLGPWCSAQPDISCAGLPIDSPSASLTSFQETWLSTSAATPTTTLAPPPARRLRPYSGCHRRARSRLHAVAHPAKHRAGCPLAGPGEGPRPRRAVSWDPSTRLQSRSRTCTPHQRKAIPGRAAPCYPSFPTRVRSLLPHFTVVFFLLPKATLVFRAGGPSP